MDEELETYFFRNIPHTYTVNENEINFSKRYSNQFTEQDLPSIVLTYIETGVVSHIYLNKLYSMSNDSIDVKLFEEDKYEYSLEVDSVNEITKIIGYYDYESDGETYTAYDEINDDCYSLELIDDKNKLVFDDDCDGLPNTDTKFKVYYEHDDIKVVFGGEFIDRVQFDIVTTDYKEDDVFINGLKLCKDVTRELMRELKFGFDHPNLVIREVSDAKDLSDIEGQDYHYRYSFDVSIAYTTSYTKYFDNIEDVGYELETQVV